MLAFCVAAFLALAPPARAAGVVETVPATLDPISDAWARSIGYAFHEDEYLSSKLKFDDVAKSMSGKPLVGALESLGHDPLTFIRLDHHERRVEIVKAKIAASRWVAAQARSAIVAAQAAGTDEAALHEAMRRISVIRLHYASYLYGDDRLHAQLADAFDSAQVKVRPGSYERLGDEAVNPKDVWGRPDDPYSAYSVPASYARDLSRRLDRAEGIWDFSAPTKEMKKLLRYFPGDDEARRILALGLVARMKKGGPSVWQTDTVGETLKELVDGMKLDPHSEKAQDSNLLESIVRGLSNARYNNSKAWLLAMGVVSDIGLKTKSPRLRLLAYEVLRRGAANPVTDTSGKFERKGKRKIVALLRDAVSKELGALPFERLEEYKSRWYQGGPDIEYVFDEAFTKPESEWTWKENGRQLAYLEREFPTLRDAILTRANVPHEPPVTERPGGSQELLPPPVKNLNEPLNLPSRN